MYGEPQDVHTMNTGIPDEDFRAWEEDTGERAVDFVFRLVNSFLVDFSLLGVLEEEDDVVGFVGVVGVEGLVVVVVAAIA